MWRLVSVYVCYCSSYLRKDQSIPLSLKIISVEDKTFQNIVFSTSCYCFGTPVSFVDCCLYLVSVLLILLLSENSITNAFIENHFHERQKKLYPLFPPFDPVSTTP